MGRSSKRVGRRNVDIAFIVSHLAVAVLACVTGRYWATTTTATARGANKHERNCDDRCRQFTTRSKEEGHRRGATLHHEITQSQAEYKVLKKSDIESQFSVQPWFDDETNSRTDETVLFVRPNSSSATGVCRRIDLIWLDSQKTQHECLVILPCRKADMCQFTSSSGHLSRLAPSSLKTGQNQWNIVPWQYHLHSTSSHVNKNPKPFRLETPPKPVVLRESWEALGHYLEHLPRMVRTLHNLVDGVNDEAGGPPITILLSNKGHIELLLNFVCAWHSLPLENHATSLDHVVVFAVDLETQQFASQLNLKVFYDPAWLQGLQTESTAASYGTHSYAILMLAKVHCAHMMSVLGRDFVFHDVDIVPLRRDYLSPLLDPQHAAYDMTFQYDFPGTGSVDQMQPEYRPWLINSGLYLVRANARTRRFFDDLVRHADLVLRSNSHQVVMNFLISQHVSSGGLKVKVLRQEADLLPGGYHFHKRWEYMHSMLNGTIHPYLFHMNYNENKDTKQKFNEQIGTWFVENSCSSFLSRSISVASCCVADPEPQCYFRDKPSKRPCPSSPFLEEGESFW